MIKNYEEKKNNNITRLSHLNNRLWTPRLCSSVSQNSINFASPILESNAIEREKALFSKVKKKKNSHGVHAKTVKLNVK